MKKITFVLFIVAIIVCNSTSAYSFDTVAKIKRVGILAPVDGSAQYIDLYVLTQNNEEFCFRSNRLGDLGLDLLKSMEAQLLYAKAANLKVVLRAVDDYTEDNIADNKTAGGWTYLWGVIVEGVDE